MGTSEPDFLPRSAPEAQGIPSSGILGFVDAVERDIRDLHSFILLRRGTVVAEGYWEPYQRDTPHMLFSLSKSFTSTAIGLLVAEGRLSIDDPVLSFFPDLAPPEPSDYLRAMRVRHLLTMTTGHDTDPTRELRQAGPDWVRAFLAYPVEHEPGTHFVYNSLATYTLSAIAQRLTGERVTRYLQPRLFGPLGIANPVWETSPEGIDTGGWGLSVTTRDIARFGQLYLQRGQWNGARLVSEAWVTAATSHQVPNGPSPNPDWEQGYGYQFWRCRHGAYRGDGAFGQFCVVLPDQEAVLAITSGVRNMQAVLNLVWEHLLPALGPTSLPNDPAERQRLADRLDALRLPPASGLATSPFAGEWSGREFAVQDNPSGITSLRFDFTPDGGTLTIGDRQGDQLVSCPHGCWSHGEGRVLGGPAPGRSGRLAASGAWTNDHTFVAELCWDETPFRQSYTCNFAGDELTVDQGVNVSFGPTELPPLRARMV